jgi:hypothetical protein
MIQESSAQRWAEFHVGKISPPGNNDFRPEQAEGKPFRIDQQNLMFNHFRRSAPPSSEADDAAPAASTSYSPSTDIPDFECDTMHEPDGGDYFINPGIGYGQFSCSTWSKTVQARLQKSRRPAVDTLSDGGPKAKVKKT